MRFFKRVAGRVIRALPEAKYTAPATFLNGFRRVYHIHIRKTAGTSINRIFMAASGGDENLIYDKVASSLVHTTTVNRYKYTGYCPRSINRGNYFYAYSHLPYWKLELPKNTFRFTCFRDPILRVLSHYKMLEDLRYSGKFHPCMAVEGKWLGRNIHDFIDNIPKCHLLNQLYMFSPEFNVSEASEAIHGLDQILYTESLLGDISRMSTNLGLELGYMHYRKTEDRTFDSSVINRLRDMLDSEYELLDFLAVNSA